MVLLLTAKDQKNYGKILTRNIAPCFTQRLICQQNEKDNDYADII